jgi:tRNA(Arg) A34 adenosine deaminase TadA
VTDLSDTDLSDTDRARLLDAVAVSRRAVEHGNHPFGAVLVDANGTVVLEAENTVTTDVDCTAHAETNLVRRAWKAVGVKGLRDHTLYTSCEPCAMCSGAIYWSGIGRVVYALPESELLVLTGDDPENPTMSLDCREVFSAGQRAIHVSGPASGDLFDAARAPHEGFWG